jgi:D-sedoheptulose 7-phosphate isomerase
VAGASPGARAGVSAAAARSEAARRFFDAEAERIARLCHAMAERFAAGGRLIAVGETPSARSDARHVAVEFVHPVIVGKRALPAIGLAGEGGPLAVQLALTVEDGDIAMLFEGAPAPAGDVLAIGFPLAAPPGAPLAAPPGAPLAAAPGAPAAVPPGAPPGPAGAAAWSFDPPTDDPFVRQELVETLYHVLWELVHVFFEHRGLLSGGVHDTGASSFLYPFLGEAAPDVDAVVADVAASVRMKSEEVIALREQTLADGREALEAAAAVLRARFAGGGRLLVLGNGGSATDAMDVAADFRHPPPGRTPRPVLDLTEDAAILTALANDIGVEGVFARQVIAHGRAGDALLAISTSGGSGNVLAALAEARRRGMATIALVGYDGGEIAAGGLADHVVVTRSQHIPRIQEAQASAYHVLRELVG